MDPQPLDGGRALPGPLWKAQPTTWPQRLWSCWERAVMQVNRPMTLITVDEGWDSGYRTFRFVTLGNSVLL